MGVSFFDGNVLNGDRSTPRTRYGIDVAHYYRQWEILLEASTGTEDAGDATSWLGETSWRSPMETVHGYERALFLAVVKSALKTLAVTESGWREDIEAMRNERAVADAFNQDE